MSRILYTKPSVGALEARYVADAVINGWGERCYDYINRFETAFKEHSEVSYAVSTSSCTGAMHMGLAGLGIGPGDEVIIGDINWIASVAPVLYLGATPVLVDVLPDTWCLDPDRVAAAITPRTKAVIAVHLYGNLCDMDRLLALGAARNVAIIEDAAEALGSVWRGRRAGSMGAFATFSFHGSKTVTTGEGGMFVTNDRKLFEQVRTLSNHGRRPSQPRQFWPDVVGFKYKLSNIQAALGLGQLERIGELIAGKRRVFDYYKRSLTGLPLTMNPEPAGTTNGFWMPTIVADKSARFDRDALLLDFRNADIDGRVFFWPLSMLPMFSPHPQHRTSHELYPRAINLPSYHDLTETEMDRVVEVVKRHVHC